MMRIFLIIFVLTACFTGDIIRQNPDNWVAAIIIWACVIGGIIVFFMAVNYFGEKQAADKINIPIGQNPDYGYPQYYYQQVPPAQAGYYAQTKCRYCDAIMTGPSPICQKCGRKNY